MMKKLGSLALMGVFAATANAQFVNGDLVLGMQSTTATTADASIFQMDKNTGTTGFNVALTGFRFAATTVGGGIKTDIDGTMYLAGASTATPANSKVGKVTTAGGFTQAVTPSLVRGAASNGAGGFYVTQGNGTAGLSHGSLTFDNSTAASLTSDNTVTTRIVAYNNGLAYYSRASTTATSNGIFDQNGTQVATVSVNANSGIVDFAMSWDGLTMYAADERNDANGGIIKYTRAALGTAFTQQYIISTDTDGAAGPLTTGARFLAVEYDASGVATIYATTDSATETSNNRLVKIVDTGASSTASVLATAGAGNLYKGVALVPEPASFAILGIGIAGLVVRRRKNSK